MIIFAMTVPFLLHCHLGFKVPVKFRFINLTHPAKKIWDRVL